MSGPQQPEAKKPYYALFIGGLQVKIRYIANDAEVSLLSPELALAWLEEKDRKIHYFLFQLGTSADADPFFVVCPPFLILLS